MSDKDMEKLQDFIGVDQPWSLECVLMELISVADTLTLEDSYDGQGYKMLHAAREEALKYLTKIEALRIQEVKPKTRKKSFTPPTQQEFIDYVTETLPSRNPDWTRETASRAAANRFDVYVESGWKDGFGKPMKVWKTKAINAILRENHWSYGSNNKSANVASEPVSQTHFGSRLLFPDSSN